MSAGEGQPFPVAPDTNGPLLSLGTANTDLSKPRVDGRCIRTHRLTTSRLHTRSTSSTLNICCCQTRGPSTLLAPKNNAEDPERTQARSDAIAQNLLDGTGQPAAANAGFMSVEQDQGLVPDAYRPVVGERVALFGRWIIDCGHDNWQSEIHPPTLTAVARKPVNQRLTHVDIVANPYLVSQEFDHGGIWNQLVYELGLVTDPVPFLVFTDQMTADASVLPPTQGLVVFSFKVRPPTPAESPQDHLFVRMHLTGRHGVVFQPFLLDGETVGVVGLLTDQLTMAARPNNHPYDVTSDELKSVSPDIGRSYAALIGILAIADPVKSVVVSRGIEASLFDTPAPPDLTNAPVMQGWANTNPWGQNPVTYDDSQPFPLIGWMEVQWGTPITPKDVLNSVRIEPWHPVKQMPGGPKKIDEQLAQLVATHPLEGAALAAKTRTAAVLVAQIAPQSAKSVDGVWNYTITWGGKGPAAWGKLTLRTTASAILGVMDTPQGQHLVKGEVIGGGAQILLTISNGKSTSQQVRLNGSPAGYIGVDQQTGTALQLTR